MAENFTFEVDEELFKGFEESHNARDEYEASEEYATDIQTENFRKEYAPIANRETAKIANDDDSGFFGSVINFGKHIGIGGAKGVEEAGQLAGELEDNAWNLPKPTTTAETLAQGFGIFLPLFVGTSLAISGAGAGAVAAGVAGAGRLASILSKSKKLRIAKDFLVGTTAGAVSDVASFDPKDPNAANFLLTTGAIANDPRAAAAVKALAQNNADDETTARLKNAAVGAIAGAITAGIIKGAGYTIKKVRGKEVIDDVPVEKLEQAAKVEAETYVEGVTKVKQEATPDQMKLFDDLPDVKPAAKEAYEQEANGYIRPWEKLTEEKKTEALAIVARWAQGTKVSDVDLSVIESMNLLKLKGSEDIKPLMQFLSERMEIKDLLKKRIKTEDFDTVSGMSKVLEIPENEAARILDEQVGNVRGAIKYVGVARALGAAEMKKAEDAFALFAKSGDREVYEKALSHTKLSYDMLASGGELSKASSDLLRSHQKLIDQVDNIAELKTMLRHSVVYSDPELSIKQAGWFTARKNVDELKVTAKFKGGTTKPFKISKKKTLKTLKEKQATKLKSLKARLASLKRPERGKPFQPIPDTPEIKRVKADIERVKAERATLKEKQKLPKEQIQARKEFERLSKRLKDLQEGKLPSKGKPKKDKTLEISKLKAEIKRVRAKLKPETSDIQKADANIKRLNEKLNKLTLAKEGEIKPSSKTPRIKTKKELELEEAIKKQEKRLGLLETKGLSLEELKEEALLQARQVEIDEINRANLAQTKSRLNAMNKSFIARTRDSLLEIYVNGLLSSVKTFEVNALGNTSAIVSSVIDRAYAGFVKRGGEVTAKEAAELGWGYLSSLKDLGKLMKQSWDLEETQLIKHHFIRPHDRSISKEAWRTGGAFGKAVDLLGNVVNFPGRILLSADEVFKTINYRAETRALAYRKAVNDPTVGSNKAAIHRKFAEIMQDINAHEDIVEGAKGFAAKNTFTNKLASHVIKDPLTGKPKVVPGLGLKLKGILDADQTGIARTFIPFFQTPANLLNFAWERTPGLRRWNRGLKERLSPDAPKAVRELAEAQVATSNVLWASTMALAFSGNFTGGPPRDPNLRKTLEADMGGPHWYSYRSDEGWVKYDRFDPIGVIMAASAHAAVMGKAAWNLHGQYQQGDPSDEIFEKYKEVLNAGVVGMVRLITDRHYLQGFSEMLNIISSEGNLEYKVRRGGEKITAFINPAQGFYSSFRRNIEAGLRPEKQRRLQRTDLNDVNDILTEIGNIFEEGMRKQVFGYGERIAMKNLAGESVLFPGVNHEIDREPFQIIANIGKAVTDPIPALQPSKSPLIKKLAELESRVAQPSSINKLNGIVLTDDEKTYFIDQWTSLNKKLEPLVSSKKFNQYPQGIQKLLIENLISRNKKVANKATLIKYKRLLDGTFDLKRYDLQSKFLKQVPTGFNQFNLGQQQPQGQQ